MYSKYTFWNHMFCVNFVHFRSLSFVLNTTKNAIKMCWGNFSVTFLVFGWRIAPVFIFIFTRNADHILLFPAHFTKVPSFSAWYLDIIVITPFRRIIVLFSHRVNIWDNVTRWTLKYTRSHRILLQLPSSFYAYNF